MVEEARELDLFVADGGDFGDGALEVALHEVADGVELHADFFDLMRGGEALAGKGSQDSSCNGSFQKSSAIHAGIVQRIADGGSKTKAPRKDRGALAGRKPQRVRWDARCGSTLGARTGTSDRAEVCARDARHLGAG